MHWDPPWFSKHGGWHKPTSECIPGIYLLLEIWFRKKKDCFPGLGSGLKVQLLQQDSKSSSHFFRRTRILKYPSEAHASLHYVAKQSKTGHVSWMAFFSYPFCSGNHVLICINHEVTWVFGKKVPNKVPQHMDLWTHMVLCLTLLDGPVRKYVQSGSVNAVSSSELTGHIRRESFRPLQHQNFHGCQSTN